MYGVRTPESPFAKEHGARAPADAWSLDLEGRKVELEGRSWDFEPRDEEARGDVFHPGVGSDLSLLLKRM